MVSSYMEMEPEELIKRLKDIAARYADDPEYQELRKAVPEEFPF